ncbi:MAG: DotI/IcmL family type IV secretion protein, partial [Solirubrobacterales bacterium]|nr:DotI/IcmL family type IV secretion protein [Solirubrobacterales bacterium]
WDSMLQSWQDNHNLDELRDERLVVHGTPIGGPVFARSPLLDHGVISWQIEVPIVATFENTKGQRKQNLLLKIVVLRAPTTIHPDGLAIDALISEPYTPGA